MFFRSMFWLHHSKTNRKFPARLEAEHQRLNSERPWLDTLKVGWKRKIQRLHATEAISDDTNN